MDQKRKILPRRKKIGKAPLHGYGEITQMELRELKNLTLEEAIKQTERLLKVVTQWKK